MTHPDIIKMERYGEPEPQKSVFICDNCGEDICEGDDYYQIGTDSYCENCIKDFKNIAEIDV